MGLLSENILSGLVVLFWLLCRPSNRCGLVSKNMMSLVLPSFTENASKVLDRKIFTQLSCHISIFHIVIKKLIIKIKKLIIHFERIKIIIRIVVLLASFSIL